jgi:beta-glucosidase
MKLISLLLIILMAASCGHKSILEDSVDRRVEDLLSQMTLQEKIGQLNQVSLLDGFSEEVASQIADGKVGSILNEADPAIINYYQKAAVEKTRLGIPLLVCRDVIHGFNTMFPIPLGLAATFDPELVQQGARMAAEEATARGIRLTFSPMLDIALFALRNLSGINAFMPPVLSCSSLRRIRWSIRCSMLSI